VASVVLRELKFRWLFRVYLALSPNIESSNKFSVVVFFFGVGDEGVV